MKLLSHDEIKFGMDELPGWNFIDNHLEKEFVLTDFAGALTFVNKAGAKAEEMNHHPDIFIHSWNKVKFILSTHSEDGVTELDMTLSKKIEAISKL